MALKKQRCDRPCARFRKEWNDAGFPCGPDWHERFCRNNKKRRAKGAVFNADPIQMNRAQKAVDAHQEDLRKARAKAKREALK